MIVTVTPNPSLDRTYHVDELRLGELHRAGYEAVEASGKGVNVSRVLLGLGVATVAVLPVGGREGGEIAELLTADGLDHRAVRVAAAARVNITITEPGGRTTKVNGSGGPLTEAEQDALVAETGRAAVAATWVTICGSLPPGTGPDLVVRLIDVARAAGARTAVDTSGEALSVAVAAGADLVKPNREELAELAGHDLPDVAAVAAAAVKLSETGPVVLASMGAEGAVLVEEGRCLWGVAPPIEPVNTAGAGDALLAGYLAACHRGPGRPGSGRPGPDVEGPDVEGPDVEGHGRSVAGRAGPGPGGPEGRLAEAVALGTSACLTAGTVERAGRSIAPADITVRRLGKHMTSGASQEHPVTGRATGQTRRST